MAKEYTLALPMVVPVPAEVELVLWLLRSTVLLLLSTPIIGVPKTDPKVPTLVTV